ncbi:hypothetical protein Bbelb_422320 [Branchiostoma belcheri]|nr:hypothetical protein Bbelb_422320 [Branchiostoma belcheri]
MVVSDSTEPVVTLEDGTQATDVPRLKTQNIHGVALIAADLERRRTTGRRQYGKSFHRRERKDDMTENVTTEVSDTDVIGNSEAEDGKNFEIQAMKETTKRSGASAQAGLLCEGDELEKLYESRKTAEHTTHARSKGGSGGGDETPTKLKGPFTGCATRKSTSWRRRACLHAFEKSQRRASWDN